LNRTHLLERHANNAACHPLAPFSDGHHSHHQSLLLFHLNQHFVGLAIMPKHNGAVLVFGQNVALEDAIGSHACSLETIMRVANDIPLRCSLLLPVGTVNCVKTLKDVSMLGAVHHLDLSHTNIVHVGLLCNVHTLKLVGCKQLRAEDLVGKLAFCQTLRMFWGVLKGACAFLMHLHHTVTDSCCQPSLRQRLKRTIPHITVTVRINTGRSQTWDGGAFRCKRLCSYCTVRVFRRKFTLEDAIGSHTCSLQASRRVVNNGIPLGCPLLTDSHFKLPPNTEGRVRRRADQTLAVLTLNQCGHT
jgi:hypothetical protein